MSQPELTLPKPECRLQYGGQVVSYDWAREVLYRLGCGCRRDGDYLVVYPQPDSGFYVKPATEQELLRKLYIDEGYYSDVQHRAGEMHGMSFPWMEYVDFVSLASVILMKLAPELEAECNGGGTLGAGSRQRHMMDMVADRLKDIGYWSHDEEAE
tara:strand:+ start:132 stop:596 length:465 start_codon:yes stop_codon:yes gene_type:complete